MMKCIVINLPRAEDRRRASHHQISPIKCGLQPIPTVQGRIRGRMPILLPLLLVERSNPGNPDREVFANSLTSEALAR